MNRIFANKKRHLFSESASYILMVYIKLSSEAWTLSGLEKHISESKILKINENRYVSYSDFSTPTVI